MRSGWAPHRRAAARLWACPGAAGSGASGAVRSEACWLRAATASCGLVVRRLGRHTAAGSNAAPGSHMPAATPATADAANWDSSGALHCSGSRTHRPIAQRLLERLEHGRHGPHRWRLLSWTSPRLLWCRFAALLRLLVNRLLRLLTMLILLCLPCLLRLLLLQWRLLRLLLLLLLLRILQLAHQLRLQRSQL